MAMLLTSLRLGTHGSSHHHVGVLLRDRCMGQHRPPGSPSAGRAHARVVILMTRVSKL